VASKEVGEEKRKEKEALRLQLEQEQEQKRLAKEKADNVIKTRVELTGPKTVGKIDLEPKKGTPKQEAEPQEKKEEAPKKQEEELPVKQEEEVIPTKAPVEKENV